MRAVGLVLLVFAALQATAGAAPAEQVTMTARPTALRWAQGATLFGAVDSRRADEEVVIQAKDCGQSSFTNAVAILTHDGGTWTTQFNRGINTTIRAVWKNAVSQTIQLRQQPDVRLVHRSGRRFEVTVGSRGQLWRKRVLIQRRVGSRWTNVKTVVLTETGAPPGTGMVWTYAEFRLSVPRGSVLRAQLPASQARPCFLPAASASVRT
jgi:hypothetical protein